MKKKKKILVIDDDRKLNSLLRNYLSQFDFEVETACHPIEGLKILKQTNADLVILDIMLPDMDGFETCKKIRTESAVPIIMLTARGDLTDRVVGLEVGADDYLSKPFEPRELLARINSIFRREKLYNHTKEKFQFAKLVINSNKRSVQLEGKDIDLTMMEYEILLLLVNNPSVVLSRDTIMDELKGLDWDPDNRSVDIMISRLRQKLSDDPKHPDFIKTIWGVGYMFIGDSID